MHHATRDVVEASLAACLLFVGAVGCGSSSSADVAYEAAYAGDYYYPADVGYSSVYTTDTGVYFVAPASNGLTTPIAADVTDAGGGGAGGAAGEAGTAGGAGAGGNGAAGSGGSGSTTARGAVGQAIRTVALGGAVCPGQVTVTRPAGTDVCGVSGAGLSIVFSGCQLSGGGTVDGTITVQRSLSASDTDCTSSTMLTVGYTSTITSLTYTGTGGAKIVIPTATDTATIQVPLGTAPSTVTLMSTGQIQRLGTDGSVTSDRSYTGKRTYSAISVSNQTYTVDGMIAVTDTAGGTATISASGLQRDQSCCRPTGGTLSVSRTGGSHAGSHTWTFSATCGSVMLDGKTVTLPACL
jgi:hypothetical protein